MEEIWKDFKYLELRHEVERIICENSNMEDYKREYQEHLSFFEKKGIIPFFLTKHGNTKLMSCLGHDETFCDDFGIPRHRFNDYFYLINLALARLYRKLADEEKSFRFVRQS